MSNSSCGDDEGRSLVELPVACNLSEQELRGRREALASNIYGDVEQVCELKDGYAFRYPGGEASAAKLLEFITFERRCCPFITFELVFEPDQGPVWLRLRGAAGIKEFIREEMRMLGTRSEG
jgi:hypothetical protein